MYQSYSGLLLAYLLLALIGVGVAVAVSTAREGLREKRRRSGGEPVAVESPAEYFAWISSQDGPRRRY